jgi:hypothetical protein
MYVTMIDPATSWFEIVELPVTDLQQTAIPKGMGQRGTPTHDQNPYFDKSSAMVGNLVNKTWFSRYPRSQSIVYDNESKFKLHFQTLCDTYGLKHKPTSVMNPQANTILK